MGNGRDGGKFERQKRQSVGITLCFVGVSNTYALDLSLVFLIFYIFLVFII